MKGHKGGGIHMVTFLLLVIGGLNWLLFGLTGWDVGQLFGEMNNVVARIIYILVGLAAIYELAMHKKTCACCGGKCDCTDKGAKDNKPEAMPKPDQGGMGDGMSEEKNQ